MNLSAELQSSVERLTRQRYHAHFHELACSSDRLFQVLMLIQFIGAVITALTFTPLTWIGSSGVMHLHVWSARRLLCESPFRRLEMNAQPT